MSVEKLVISKEASSFTVLPNKVLQKLTKLDALGMWVYLASLPPTWEFYKEQLRNHFRIGKDKLEKILLILRECNLITLKAVRNAQGQFAHWHIHVLSGSGFAQGNAQEEVQEQSISYDNAQPDTEKPVTGKPLGWKQEAIKEIKNKDNIKYKTNITCASDDARKSFDQFWNIYPRKKDKQRAFKIWIDTNCHEKAEIIINKLGMQVLNDSQWKTIQYIPHPTTYLRNARWEDEVTLERMSDRKESGMERAARLCLN
jgi:hypothetical protein